ncbi:MAG: aldo/keto reductase [Acutalibacteraceae bacterium]
MEGITLENGYKLPAIAYGSGILSRSYRGGIKSKLKKANDCFRYPQQYRLNSGTAACLRTLLDSGFSMVDTSSAYGMSEQVIGEELKRFPRADARVITKLCNQDQFTGNVEQALKKSLSRLGMDYVDVYLMHWPVTDVYPENWKKMEDLYRRGLCKAIGVCNCHRHHLEEILKIAQIKPMINQIECHPLLTQDELREYCRQNGIQVMAYTPTARMDERLRKTVLVKLAAKYHKSVAQIILRWHIQLGNIPVVNTLNPVHLAENANIFDFALSEAEMQEITAININSRLRYDPDNCDFSQL